MGGRFIPQTPKEFPCMKASFKTAFIFTWLVASSLNKESSPVPAGAQQCCSCQSQHSRTGGGAAFLPACNSGSGAELNLSLKPQLPSMSEPADSMEGRGFVLTLIKQFLLESGTVSAACFPSATAVHLPLKVGDCQQYRSLERREFWEVVWQPPSSAARC